MMTKQKQTTNPPTSILTELVNGVLYPHTFYVTYTFRSLGSTQRKEDYRRLGKYYQRLSRALGTDIYPFVWYDMKSRPIFHAIECLGDMTGCTQIKEQRNVRYKLWKNVWRNDGILHHTDGGFCQVQGYDEKRGLIARLNQGANGNRSTVKFNYTFFYDFVEKPFHVGNALPKKVFSEEIMKRYRNFSLIKKLDSVQST